MYVHSSEMSNHAAADARHVVDIFLVFIAAFGVFYLEDLAVAQGWISVWEDARGASAMIAGALAALAVNRWRGGSLADLGFKRPRRWAIVPLQVFCILVTLVVLDNLLPVVISSFATLPEPDVSRHAWVTGNPWAALFMLAVLPFTASIPEEIIFRGFLIDRLSGMFGRHAAGTALAVIFQALVFGSIHFQWGIGGMILTVIMGLVWGVAYVLCDRNLWVVILAHSAGHVVFVLQLYLGQSIIV